GLTIPIVALTAHAMSGDAEKCRTAGCSEYLTKPIQEQTLLKKIAELMSCKKSEKPAAGGTDGDSPEKKTNAVAVPGQFEDSIDCNDGKREVLQVKCALPLYDETFREIVQEFSVKVNSQIERMKLAYAAEDWKDLVELAHWLKGSGGTAGYE